MNWTGERVIPLEMDLNDQHQQAILTSHLDRYKFALDFCIGKSVLDASCGSGYGAKLLSSVARSVLGVDISQETIHYAATHYYVSGVSFTLCDLENDFPVNYYDTIVSFETIEHLINPHPFLKHCSESCQQFIFSIPMDNKSEFHKQVYSEPQAMRLIETYFTDVRYQRQVTGKKHNYFDRYTFEPFIETDKVYLCGVGKARKGE
jgi:2-polyprenyl-3-methyl-5-hydroxy-6-metoxy-1,4-benzoquinol methylase